VSATSSQCDGFCRHLWTGDAWSNARAKNHARGTHRQSLFQLLVNAYRVLLLCGRD